MNDLVVLPPVEPIEQDSPVRSNRVTNEDKRKKVESFFADFPQLQALSNREIAKRCGVTELLVRKVKKELQEQRQKELQELARLDAVIETMPGSMSDPEPESTVEAEPRQPEVNHTACSNTREATLRTAIAVASRRVGYIALQCGDTIAALNSWMTKILVNVTLPSSAVIPLQPRGNRFIKPISSGSYIALQCGDTIAADKREGQYFDLYQPSGYLTA